MKESLLTSGARLQRQGQVPTNGVENLIVIGASAGGQRALVEIFKNLSADMPAAIVLLLHLPLTSPSNLTESLGRFSRLPMIEVEHRELLQQGFIFIPPPGRSVVCSDGMLMVEHGVPARPATTINSLFRSSAQVYRERVIGVILTGLLRDGTEGLRAVHDAGGLTIVQNPREAEYSDMPANAMERLPVTFCLNLAEIAPALELLVRRTAQFESGLEVAVRTLRDRAALLVRLIDQSSLNPGTHEFLIGELAALRSDIESILRRNATLEIVLRESEQRSKEAEEQLRHSQEELAMEVADVELLQQISNELIQQESVKGLYEKIADAAVAIMRSDFASMQILYPERGEGGELLLLACRGFSPEAARFWEWVPVYTGSTCAVALRTGKRVIVSDVEACEFMAGTEDLRVYRQAAIRAVQSTPLHSRTGQIVGMISTHWRERHTPSERDLRTFDILARQAADLIEQRRAEQAALTKEGQLQVLTAGLESREINAPYAPQPRTESKKAEV